MNKYIKFSDEILKAKDKSQPIVALESTIISHGMPYPQNLNTALEVEAIIRDNGAIPATIALLDGHIHVGLEKDELEFFAGGNDIHKASKRDLSYMLYNKLAASTTVAATMYCANLAGIEIFATGGIGGVHKGAQESFDISADLDELSKTPVTVVCAGAKSILDLPKTLEVLETLSVPVIGYNTKRLPAFYSEDSGVDINQDLVSAEDIAEFIKIHKNIELKSGILVTNPIPTKDSIALETIEPITAQANLEAKNLTGAEVTPFILKRINELSKGASLKANISLIKNNALLAAQIAKSMQN